MRRALREILDDIATERYKQDEQWGGAVHDDRTPPRLWLERRARYEGCAMEGVGKNQITYMRYSLVKLAALAVAQIEAMDRRTTAWGCTKCLHENPYQTPRQHTCEICGASRYNLNAI